MPRGDKPTTVALALKDGWVYEDTLPVEMSQEQYDWWFKESLVLDGVRMGPPLDHSPTNPSSREDGAPERIFAKACHPDSPNRNCTWTMSLEPSEGSVEYTRISPASTAPVVDKSSMQEHCYVPGTKVYRGMCGVCGMDAAVHPEPDVQDVAQDTDPLDAAIQEAEDDLRELIPEMFYGPPMPARAAAATAAPQAKSCGFCGKSDQEVKALIQAPVGYICDECVAVCASIIERDRTAAPVEQSDWLPIESAPKDGTEILLTWHWNSGIHHGVSVVLTSWYCRTHAHLSRHKDCPNEPDCKEGWGAYAGLMSHWMPLPAPPVTIP